MNGDDHVIRKVTAGRQNELATYSGRWLPVDKRIWPLIWEGGRCSIKEDDQLSGKVAACR